MSGLWTDDQGSVVLGEEILVQAFELDRLAGTNPHSMFNHQVGEVLAIKQNDALGKVLNKFAGLRTER